MSTTSTEVSPFGKQTYDARGTDGQLEILASGARAVTTEAAIIALRLDAKTGAR